ncbi:MAG: hypothetical protein JSV66_13265 [Trueperaceae bacterium]|nr:MAG: hypothetical protein JSV66_13265 [Trueperaceae bacterium]
MELHNATLEAFEAVTGEGFRLAFDDGEELELRLHEVRALAEQPRGNTERIPFSLLFTGPATPILEQRIYPLEHERLGRLEIFLVPLGPVENKIHYEAIFT